MDLQMTKWELYKCENFPKLIGNESKENGILGDLNSNIISNNPSQCRFCIRFCMPFIYQR